MNRDRTEPDVPSFDQEILDAAKRRLLRIPAEVFALPDGTMDQTLRLAYASHTRRARRDYLAYDPAHIRDQIPVEHLFMFDRPDWRETVFGKPAHRLPVMERGVLLDHIVNPEPDTFIIDLRSASEVGPEGIFPTAHHFPAGAAAAISFVGRSLMTHEDQHLYASEVRVGAPLRAIPKDLVEVPAVGASERADRVPAPPGWALSPFRVPTRSSEIILVSHDGTRAEMHGILLRLDGHLGPIWNYRGGLNEWFTHMDVNEAAATAAAARTANSAEGDVPPAVPTYMQRKDFRPPPVERPPHPTVYYAALGQPV